MLEIDIVAVRSNVLLIVFFFGKNHEISSL